MGQVLFLNCGFGDASLIKSNSSTYLIDCEGIGFYSNLLPENKKIRGVFITHQHRDHYSGLEFLKRKGFRIDFLIYSPYERRKDDSSVTYEEWREFRSYVDYFTSNGTGLRTPYRQSNFEEPFWDQENIKFWVLGPAEHIAKSETREIHDACLVIKCYMFYMSSRSCLFTGDASDLSLDNISSTTNNICDDILHASHHGSINGANLDFIKKCNMDYTIISTKVGVKENVPHPTALKRYNDNTKIEVHRTDINGSKYFDF